MIPAFSFQDPSLCRYLPEGVFSIGVDEPRADMIAAAVDGVQVKASYLMNLCPRHELFLPAVSIARRRVSSEEFALFVRETGFMDNYVSARFLPHTDGHAFPSVLQRVSRAR